jgi:hypothetical protein
MKGRTILVLLGVLLILAAAATLFETNRRRATTASGDLLFPDLKVEDVDRIEITDTGGQEVVLEKQGERWRVASEGGRPAEPKLVTDILDRLPKLTADQVVSTNPERQALFQVDTSGVVVHVSQKGKRTADFIVGKPGPDFLSTYVRAAGSDRVIQVPEYLPSLVSGHATWREKTLFALEQDNLRRYEYQSPSRGHLLLTRDEAGVWSLEQPETGTADESRTSILLRTFGTLKVREFADTVSVEAAGLGADTTWVQATTADGVVHRLQIGGSAPRNQRYARRQGSDAIVTIPGGSVNTMMPVKEILLTPSPS